MSHPRNALMFAQLFHKHRNNSSCISIACARAFLIILLATALSTTMANERVSNVAKAGSQFASSLYDILSAEEGNVFFSPLSVHTILSLLYQGAEKETAQQLSAALRIPAKAETAEGYQGITTALNSISNVTLHIANKVFLQDSYKLKPSFGEVALKSFDSEAQSVNFAENEKAAKTINSWVEQKTNDKIKDLILPSDLDSLTRLVLVNAIYFKGDWLKKFNKDRTTVEKFYTSLTDSVDCNMMHINGKYNYAEIEELDAKVLQMPYTNEDVSMVIILPNARDGIKDLEAKLKNYDLSSVTNQMRHVSVDVSLPRFKVETTIPLNEPLKKLGLGDMFTTKANFSGLLDSDEPLYVSKAIQKAFIEVNEEGAEAAAATGIVLMTRSMPIMMIKKEFIADHPFIYSLVVKKDEESVNLFLGRLATTV